MLASIQSVTNTLVKTVADQEENIRSAMEEHGHGSQQVLEAIGNVNELSVRNRENIDFVIREVSRFKVD